MSWPTREAAIAAFAKSWRRREAASTSVVYRGTERISSIDRWRDNGKGNGFIRVEGAALK